MMLDVPDRLVILTDPLVIEQCDTAALRLEINAKNGFLPRYAHGLSVVIGSELKDHVRVVSMGLLLGGKVRVTLEASPDAPTVSTSMKVVLVVQELGVLLTAEGKVEVIEPKEDEGSDKRRGREPNIDVRWVGRDTWQAFDPPWDERAVRDCNIYRDDPIDKTAITKVEWILNEAFAPYEKVITEKRLGEQTLRTFKEGCEYPPLYSLFKQALAEEAREREADEEGRRIEVRPLRQGEKARLQVRLARDLHGAGPSKH